MDSISECARMASVSSEFAAAFRGWLAETHVVDMRNVCCDDGELERILQGTPSARSILLGSAPDVTSEGVASAIASAKALHGWRHLDHLALQSISASELWELLSSLEHLTALDIDDNALLDELDVCMLASGCMPRGGLGASRWHGANLSASAPVPPCANYSVVSYARSTPPATTSLAALRLRPSVSRPELRQVRLAEPRASSTPTSPCCEPLRTTAGGGPACSATIESVAALVSRCIQLRPRVRCCAGVAAPGVCTVGRGCPAFSSSTQSLRARVGRERRGRRGGGNALPSAHRAHLTRSSTPSPASAAEQEARGGGGCPSPRSRAASSSHWLRAVRWCGSTSVA